MKLGMYIMPPTGHLNGVVNKAEDGAITWKHAAHFVKTAKEQTPCDSIYNVGSAVEETE
jgi:hypothetical protein